uniref:G protein-coupled receptor n=1 Tax=Panagrolaimus sp. JU765 TaxID=591449 RepID=A0AC34Q4C9_9BILA
MLLIIIFCAVINTVCALSLYRKRNSTPTISKSREAEISLFIVSAAEFLAEASDAAYCLFMAVRYAMTGADLYFRIHFYYMAWFHDLAIFSRPCLLFTISKTVKNAFLEFYGTSKYSYEKIAYPLILNTNDVFL